jgi:hypothetical protein
MSSLLFYNIANSTVKGNCDMKCDYNFKYHNSNSIATNETTYIQISYENSGIPPVTFNNIKYNVDFIQLYFPSYILYNGETSPATLIIAHTSVSDGSVLYVFLPIIISEDNTKASTLLNSIISSVSTNAPNAGESVTLSISDFTLQDIIPKKPFYTWTDPNASNFTFLCYDLNNAVSISQTSYNSLIKIISSYTSTNTPSNLQAAINSGNTTNIASFYYNSKGPNTSSTGDDDIYISCQPTGNSEEDENVTFKKSKNSTTTFDTDLSKILKNPFVVYVLYGIVFLILLVFLNMIINILSSGKMQIAKTNTSTN